jgi:hypothetical protein
MRIARMQRRGGILPAVRKVIQPVVVFSQQIHIVLGEIQIVQWARAADAARTGIKNAGRLQE